MKIDRDFCWSEVVSGLLELAENTDYPISEMERKEITAAARLCFGLWRREERIDGAYAAAMASMRAQIELSERA